MTELHGTTLKPDRKALEFHVILDVERQLTGAAYQDDLEKISNSFIKDIN